MSAITELLEEAKEKAGLKTDNALAVEIGITRQTLSMARHGKTTFGAYSRRRLADLTGRKTDEINALIEIETETDETKKEYWKSFYKRLGGVAASIYLCVTLGFVTLIVSPTPANAAETLKTDNTTMYIMLNRRIYTHSR